jgi:hypothetical protein
VVRTSLEACVMLSGPTDRVAPLCVVFSIPCYFLSLRSKDSQIFSIQDVKVSEVKSTKHFLGFNCFNYFVSDCDFFGCHSQIQS